MNGESNDLLKMRERSVKVDENGTGGRLIAGAHTDDERGMLIDRLYEAVPEVRRRPESAYLAMRGQEREAQILLMWREDEPVSGIARIFMVSEKTINNLIVKLRRNLGTEQVPYRR